MVDRVIVYDSALPQTTDMLNTNLFQMQGMGWALQAVLGSSIEVAGLTCVPTVPPSLQVTVGPGTIYALDQTDASAYGDLGTNPVVIIKQGILNAPVTLTITPPTGAGFNQVYLVEAILFDQDTGLNVLPYFNAANPSQPFSGPDNDGLPNFTIRQTTCQIALKPGLAAPAGTETIPAPDAGYTGLFTIDVPNGLTQITSTLILPVANAPRFPILPFVPTGVQTNEWTYGVDTGVANAYAATVDTQDRQPLTTLTPGTMCYLKVLHSNTGASTFNLNGLGAVNIIRANGANVSSGDILANMVVALIYDGTNWQMLNFEGASTTGSNVFNTISIPYAVDSGSANTYVGPFSPAITTLSAGLIVILKISHNNTGASTFQANATAAASLLDVFGNPLTANTVQAGEVAIMIYDGTNWKLVYTTTSTGSLKNVQVFTSSGTYTPTVGATKGIAFATGGGGAGGSNSGSPCNGSSGGISGATALSFINLVGVGSLAVTIGAGGAPASSGATGGTKAGAGGQTSLGSVCIASGGPGGFNNIKDDGGYPSDPRETPSGTGLLVMPGGTATQPIDHRYQSMGGMSFWGGGQGIGGWSGGNSGKPPLDAKGYGQGGGAATLGGSSGSHGSSGVVVILEF